MKRLVTDTTAAGAAVRRCSGRNLLPDQEGVVDGTLRLLRDARVALARDDLRKAVSLARQARQLSSSLSCL